MTTEFGTHTSLRQAQDGFQSMVGSQCAYPDDPQHPDPTFAIEEPAQEQDGTGERPLKEKARGFIDTLTDRADDLSEAAKRTFAPTDPPFPVDDEPYVPTAGETVAPVGSSTDDAARNRIIENQMYGEHEV